MNKIQEMNNKLKEIRNYEDLENLRAEYKDEEYMLVLKKNKRNKNARPLNGDWPCNNPERMTYIVDGDDRVRECKVSNLWRYVEFS